MHMSPAAIDQTGTHRLDQTGSHRLDQTGSHRLSQTGPQAPVSAMTGPPMPRSRQPEPAYRDYAEEVAEAAQYSAVPYSALPYSGMPYSAVPYDSAAYAIAPQSIVPNSLVTQGAMAFSAGAYAARGGWKSPHTDESYRSDTGGMPRVGYSDIEPSSASPSYPASWGAAPDAATRPEFRSGPRSRFS
jgi:hypothetical protein